MMNNNFKIWLCGMTANKKNEADRTTKDIYKYFNGLIWVDHFSEDGTFELLSERKGDGKIIQIPWTNQHDVSMNIFLHGGNMKRGDVFVLKDSIEFINEDFCKNMREYFSSKLKEGFNTFVASSKPFAAVYRDDLFFLGSPHYGLRGLRGKAIDVHQEIGEKQTIWRPKDGEPYGRPFWNEIDHMARYCFVYGRSNNMLLGMENDIPRFEKLEQARITFREICADVFNIKFSLNELKDLLETDKWKSNETFIFCLNEIKYLKNFYRFHILKHSFDEIKKTEEEWRI